MDLKQLEQVASHLAKRPVTIRYQPPVWDGAGGAAYKTKTGAALIDLNPGSDPLINLCHEAAHICVDWASMERTDIWKMEPRSLKISPAVKASAQTAAMESRADHFASIWLNYAARWAWYYMRPTVFESKLAALVEWPARDVESALKMWAEQKALEAIGGKVKD